ncbi:MAG TPA: hypothetical protein VJU58_10100 [Microbacterium sp.]|nr:hypothetical protein [Microbacterium sp.]
MDLIRRLSLFFVVACAPVPATQMHAAALTAGDCLPLVTGTPAQVRDAIQAAMDAATARPDGGTVCLGAGRWTVERKQPGAYNRFAALDTHSGHPLTLRGVGPETVLELVGDQGAETAIVLSIDPGAEHVLVTDLTIDTAAATNTAEQTHAIATSGICSGATCKPIRDIEVRSVHFNHPRNTPARKGDCVRLIGNEAPTTTTLGTELYGFRVIDNTGDCARSFVEIQRGIHDGVVADNTITCATCDQDIDGEATGVNGTDGRPTGIVISGNTFYDGPGTQGDFSISMTSATGVTIVGNTLPRGIALYRSTDVAIAGNAISAMNTTTERGVIEAVNACEGLTLVGNVVRRGGHLGPLITLSPHSGTTCSGATIAGNTLTQGTPAWAIKLESASRTLVTGNRIAFAVPAPAFSGVYSHSVMAAERTTGLMISNNLITGAVTYGVTLEAYPGSFGPVSVTGNTAPDVVFGLRCAEQGFAGAVTASGNAWPPGVWPTATVTNGTP